MAYEERTRDERGVEEGRTRRRRIEQKEERRSNGEAQSSATREIKDGYRYAGWTVSSWRKVDSALKGSRDQGSERTAPSERIAVRGVDPGNGSGAHTQLDTRDLARRAEQTQRDR